MGIMAGPDLQAFLHATTSVKAFFHAAWRVAFHILDLITYRRGMQLVNGTGADRPAGEVGRRARRQMWVDPRRRGCSPTTARSPGAVVSPRMVRSPSRAPRGAAGRRRVPERRRAAPELFPRTPTGTEHWTLAPPETTGDGVSLGESAGARLDKTLASPAAWCPVSLVPYRNGRVGTYPHIVDRASPG